jgi:putative hemolysin
VGFIGWAVVFICLMTVLILFFSVNASALRSFSRLKLQEAYKAAGKEEQADKFIELITENSEKLILTCSFFRLILNIGALLLLVAITQHLRKGYLETPDFILLVIFSTFIFSIFSLAIPHAWAKYAGEKIISKTYPLLMIIVIIVSPVLSVMKMYDVFVRRLSGVPSSTDQEKQEEKQEEFLEDLEQHRMEGAVDEEEQEMIENVLELSESTADQIMTPRTEIIALEVNSDLNTVLETITNAGHSRVPVYEGNIDNIVGLVYAKDLLKEIGKDPKNFNLRDRIREAYFVPESKSLRALLHEFQNQKLHIAVVLDEYGGTAGIVTLEDIIEEVVGEITDEYEEHQPDYVEQIDSDTIEIDARMYIDDLNDKFNLDLPEEEDYDTVGGFVFAVLGYIPKTGETFEHNNVNFTITSAETRRINRIRIQKHSEQQL